MKPFFASWQLYGAKLQGGRHGWRPGAKKGGSATSEGEAEEAARCLWIGVGDHQPRIGKIYHTTRIICLQFLYKKYMNQSIQSIYNNLFL
jgi:hypothetical protein